MLIREELDVKAHSVLASREVLCPGWKLLPSAVGTGRLVWRGCVSLSCFRQVETGETELFPFQGFLLADVVLDTSQLRNICPCCGLPCYPDVVTKAGRTEAVSLMASRTLRQEEIYSRSLIQ